MPEPKPAIPAPIFTVADSEIELSNAKTFADIAKVLGNTKFDWHNWIARGYLSAVGGYKGDGKSNLMLRMTMPYICRTDWPDGTPYKGRAGKVLWVETEAGQGINAERASKWGLPLEKIITPLNDAVADVSLEDESHRKAIKHWMEKPEVLFMVIDALRGSYRGKEEDSRNSFIIRWVAELLRDTQKAGLLSHHLRKPDRGIEDYQITIDDFRGSSAIVQYCRVVWAIDQPDPKDTDRRRLMLLKSNLSAAKVEPIGWYIRDNGLEFVQAPIPYKDESDLEVAIKFLKRELSFGRKPQKDVEQDAHEAKISDATLKRAKEALHIKSEREGTVWFWVNPLGAFLDI